MIATIVDPSGAQIYRGQPPRGARGRGQFGRGVGGRDAGAERWRRSDYRDVFVTDKGQRVLRDTCSRRPPIGRWR